MTGIEIVHERITQHQSVLANIQLNGVAGILSGAVIGEGGSHWLVAYERIIRAYGSVSGHPVQVIRLSHQALPNDQYWIDNTY